MPSRVLPETTERAIDSSSDDEIMKRMAQCVQAQIEMTEQRDANTVLGDLQEKVKKLRDSYNNPIKDLKLEISYCKRVLDGRGKGVDVSPDDV